MREQRPSAVDLSIPADSAKAVRAGHPWVYGPLRHPAAGTPVRLRDPRGRVCGYGLADEGTIAVRVLGRGEPPRGGFEELVVERVRRADRFRFRMIAGQTDTWRVIHGAGDGLPGVVLDRYGPVAVLKLYSAAWIPWIDVLIHAIRGLGWPTGLLRRYGVRQVDGQTGSDTLFGEVPDALVVMEHGMKLLVRPRKGQKTGLFLDQREHRLLVRSWSAGRRVANLFAYNGGFSIAAALGGASRVFTVDIAPAAIEDAKEIFRLNGLDPDGHAFEVADVFRWEPPGRFGMIIVDPPSMARGNRSRGAAANAYRKLHRRLAPHVERDGLLVSSSCTAQLGWDRWYEAVRSGLAAHGAWSSLHQSRAPLDHPVRVGHPEGQYLKLALFRRLWSEDRIPFDERARS